MTTEQLALHMPELVEPAYDTEALPDRFWAKVQRVPSGCWIWTAARWTGYGRVAFNGRVRTAHRVAYEALVGPIPTGLVLDHLCRNRACVNPEHLEPVTNRENILRGVGASARHSVKTRCPSGHAYSSSNTYLYRSMRMCKTCRSERSAQSTTARVALAVRSDLQDSRHGSLTAYSTYGCRCDQCREAWRDYMRAYRARMNNTT